MRQMPVPFRSFASYYHPELLSERVTGYTTWAIGKRLRYWLDATESNQRRYQHYIDTGSGFARRVRADLRRSDDDLDQFVFFGYDTGSLEVLEFLSDTGCYTIVDQIDPGRTEKEIVLEETERWPGWAEEVPVLYEPYQERRAAEWNLASAIVVNSEWSKRALMKQGVSEDKIHVVPLVYESNTSLDEIRKSSNTGKLRVLWLGSVILRKGIQYLVAAARKLQDVPVTFDVVGPIGITEEAMASAPSNMNFRGPVPGDQVSSFYNSADVFVLPTLSDGFALTQLEAMAHGLPVIATPNCGRVVTDEVDGRIVPPRDVDALVEAIASFVGDRARLKRMSEQARSTSQAYTLDRCAEALLSIPEKMESISP